MKRYAIVLLALGVVFLSACGGGPTGPSPDPFVPTVWNITAGDHFDYVRPMDEIGNPRGITELPIFMAVLNFGIAGSERTIECEETVWIDKEHSATCAKFGNVPAGAVIMLLDLARAKVGVNGSQFVSWDIYFRGQKLAEHSCPAQYPSGARCAVLPN